MTRIRETTEAEATIADARIIEDLIRRIEGEIEETKAKLKESRDEWQQAVASLRRLFSAESNDADRPMFAGEEDGE